MVELDELEKCYIDTMCIRCSIKSFYTLDKFLLQGRTNCAMCGGGIYITQISGMSERLYQLFHKEYALHIANGLPNPPGNYYSECIMLLREYIVKDKVIQNDSELIHVWKDVEQW